MLAGRLAEFGPVTAALKNPLWQQLEHGFYGKGFRAKETHIFARQVHSNRVLTLADDALPETLESSEADAMISSCAGHVLAVRTADCVPILICALDSPWVGAVHAGRRGAVDKILSQSVMALESQGVMRADMRFAIGPHIARESYEVGEGLYAGLPSSAKHRAADGRACCDLLGLLRQEFAELGISESQFELCVVDTMLAKDWHSYRRDGGQAGRNVALIAAGWRR
jgi:YfiH family protein